VCGGHDHSSPWIESQGYMVIVQGQRSMSSACGRGNAVTRSVSLLSSIEDSFSRLDKLTVSRLYYVKLLIG